MVAKKIMVNFGIHSTFSTLVVLTYFVCFEENNQDNCSNAAIIKVEKNDFGIVCSDLFVKCVNRNRQQCSIGIPPTGP